MPPFRYEAFVNPYIGSISELMGKGDQAKAEALLRIGEIQARAAEQRGQAWGNAIQGLGNIASKAITDYNDPKAREARAIDKAQKILDDRSKQLVTGQAQRMIPGTLQPGSTSQEFVVPESRGIGADVFGRTNFGAGSRLNVTTDETFALAQADPNGQTIDNALPNEGLRNALSRSNAFGPTERLPGSTSSVAQTGMQPNQRASSFGRMEERITPPRMNAPQVETYDKAPRNRYTTSQGLYDVRLAYDDLVKAGVSTKIAIALAGQGQQANSIFAAYDKDKEELDKKQIAVRGSIANMAIQLMDTGMSAQDALRQASGPAGNRISQDDMNAFAVQLNSQPTEQDKKNLFLSEVEAWDAQSPQKVLGRDDVVQGVSKRILGQGLVTPPPQKRALTETEILFAAAGNNPEKFLQNQIDAANKLEDGRNTRSNAALRNSWQIALQNAKKQSMTWAKTADGKEAYMTPEEIRSSGATRPDTADMRNKAVGRENLLRTVDAVQTLSGSIITKIGPSQRADALKRGVAAAFGSDPEFKTYQDARVATAGNLAVAQQGSRPSDADVIRIWLPLVPDAYSDTEESAVIKWNLIRTMSNIPTEESVAM